MNSRFYVVAQSDSPQGGIYQYAIDAEGNCRELSFCPVRQSNWLEFAPDGKHAYATGMRDGIAVITALTVTPGGGLQPENSVTLEQVPGCPCHIAVYQEGGKIYTANYNDGSFSELALDAQGRLEGAFRTFRHTGRSVHPTRQTSPHVHQVNVEGSAADYRDLIYKGRFAVPHIPCTPVRPGAKCRARREFGSAQLQRRRLGGIGRKDPAG